MENYSLEIRNSDLVPEEVLLGFVKDTGLVPSITANFIEYSFSGEFFDLTFDLVSTMDSFFENGLYDIFKYGIIRVFENLINKPKSFKIKLILNDFEKNKSFEVILDTKENSVSEIEIGLNSIDDDSMAIFNKKQYVLKERKKEVVRFFYNKKTKKMEPFDFEEFKRKINDHFDDLQNLDG